MSIRDKLAPMFECYDFCCSRGCAGYGFCDGEHVATDPLKCTCGQQAKFETVLAVTTPYENAVNWLLTTHTPYDNSWYTESHRVGVDFDYCEPHECDDACVQEGKTCRGDGTAWPCRTEDKLREMGVERA